MPSSSAYLEERVERRRKLSSEERRTEALEGIEDNLHAIQGELRGIFELLRQQVPGR